MSSVHELQLIARTKRKCTELLARAVQGDTESARRLRRDYDAPVREWCARILKESDDPATIAALVEVAWTRFILKETTVEEARRNLASTQSLEFAGLLRCIIALNQEEILKLAAEAPGPEADDR